jgi:hypothetical protein
MPNLDFLGKMELGHGWHAKGARFYPRNGTDFSDLPTLFREFVAEGHVPAEPLLREQDRVLTFGSCFAGHLRRILVDTGFAAEAIEIKEYLNNTFALRDFVTWCCTGELASNAYRYERDPSGKISEWMPTAEHFLYREHIATAAALVFVVGLAEVWEDALTGQVFWRGVPEATYDERRHRSRVSTVAENVANLESLVAVVRELNPGAQIVFSLSPVPCRATYRPFSCLTADSVSKAILRLALDELIGRRLAGVWYWPSFEMVRTVGMHTHGAAFGDDGVVRHPSDRVVCDVVDCFVRCYYQPSAHELFRERRAARDLRLGTGQAFDAYALGNLIDFTDLFLGPRHRRQGWSPVEKTGVWTEGAEAALSFTLGETPEDVELILQGHPFVVAAHPENGLRLSANGQQIGHFRFGVPMKTQTLRAIIPRDVIADANGRLCLELHIDAPCSPRAIGLSEDARKLGFHIRTLRMVPHFGREAGSVPTPHC